MPGEDRRFKDYGGLKWYFRVSQVFEHLVCCIDVYLGGVREELGQLWRPWKAISALVMSAAKFMDLKR